MSPTPPHPERPIQKTPDDRLDRSRFIGRLAAALVNPTTRKATGVVVGVTGPWGSGKSSILNLLQDHLETQYEDALIVRFDPWLVSGRNDLIGEFLGELIGTIRADAKRLGKYKKLAANLADYGAQLAPIGNLWKPGFGTILAGGLRSLKDALSQKESLDVLRRRLIDDLDAIQGPIVVLIDEIDRVEDDEIRTVAQLVRSVADFPGISYVLAYDPDRVVQALGSGASPENREERGRAYLEKIVQLQLPLPITFADEITRLLNAEIATLASELSIPEAFDQIDRYRELVQLLIEDVIDTPRDVRRLVGTYHVLAGMLQGEVDWIDLLGFSALSIKAPRTCESIRREPDLVVENPISERGILRHINDGTKSREDRIGEIVPSSERHVGTTALLGFLFPYFAEDPGNRSNHSDAIRFRRPLLTTLRLGLLPGAVSRDDIIALTSGSPFEVEGRLQRAFSDGTLEHLIDRLDDVYVDLASSIDHVAFWHGIAKFVRKPDCEWQAAYQPMYEIIRSLASTLDRSMRRRNELRAEGAAVFKALADAGESELTAQWLRRHIFVYGLFGREKRGGEKWFLTAEQTSEYALELTQKWQQAHLSGKLIPCHWSLQQVYAMMDTKLWDDECRSQVGKMLEDKRAVDGLALMLFGASFSTDEPGIEKLYSYEAFIRKAKQRLAEDDQQLHETVRLALQKAVNGGW
ncbi:energy-coupling factor transporter ATP-binding protein EcfA2 [Microvirga lupini]|uniref:Energy-coupling factor transporter ATP-binding protein EcfA2 n=1 Tax=Microvirga lupini TaxID=420324 RepID=A0A7W4VPB4_9HYPH|nr:KAP family NTPase [Microvirga lupini]MBB3020844.1 energy-coupling factor transporter ATP-binding protein EcfA2 [Microvirga lupini]